MKLRIFRAALVFVSLAVASQTATAYDFWLDHNLDPSRTHYRSAAEACYLGELQSWLDYYKSTSTSQYRISSFYLGPDQGIGEQQCRGVIEVYSAGHWVSTNAIDTLVYESSAPSPSCPLGGLADPETGLCGYPKCDGNCPISGGNGSDPIDSAVGNSLQHETDYAGSGAFPIRFERYYNSIRTFENLNQPVGAGWTHSHSGFLSQIVNSSNTVDRIRVYRPNGAV